MMKWANLVLLPLIAGCAPSLQNRDVRTGEYYVFVGGETLLIADDSMRESYLCILGSANDRTLQRLRQVGDERKLTITFEVLPMPRFLRERDDGMIGGDRIGMVRGQIIVPNCDFPEFYWVRSFRLAD